MFKLNDNDNFEYSFYPSFTEHYNAVCFMIWLGYGVFLLSYYKLVRRAI